MDLKKKLYLIIDAGGTYFKSAITDNNAKISVGSSFQTKSYSKSTADCIISAYHKTISHGIAHVKKNNGVLDGIGIATPGPFDYNKGIPLMKHKFASIYGLNLSEIIYSRPDIKQGLPICYMHDANAALAGELWKGNAKGFANVALVTLGTGLGFAYSQNGVIRYNPEGGPGKSIFTLPYKDGILEDYASKRGIIKLYNEKNGKSVQNIDVSDIGKRANQGESTSIETFSEIGRILAEVFYNILDQHGIQCLLFGGQISRSFHHMEGSLKTGLNSIKSLERISTVKNIDDAALYGVLWKILNN